MVKYYERHHSSSVLRSAVGGCRGTVVMRASPLDDVPLRISGFDRMLFQKAALARVKDTKDGHLGDESLRLGRKESSLAKASPLL